jgi:flavin-dependent dehydrogenase
MYDAIIIGARCACSPTAMLLARKGYRVLLVDKASFPSDTISTHIIWPHAAEVMDGWGLLDRLAATGCPPVALNMIFDVGPFALKGGVIDTNGGRGGFCPRRTVLDKILVDAAVESGAELRENFTVESLVLDGDRVAGIEGAWPERRQRRRACADRHRRGRRALVRGEGRRCTGIRCHTAARNLLL